MGLHGRLEQGPDRPAARDPQRRVRAARRPQPRRPQGPGQRAGLRDHGHVDPATGVRRDRPPMRSITGTYQVPCYLDVCGAERDGPASTTARRARRAADPDPGQRRDGAVRVHRPELRDAARPRRGSRSTATGCSARTPRSMRPACRTWPASTTWSSARPTGGASPRATPLDDAAALGEPEPVRAGRRPAPAGRAQHPVPRPADGQPAGLCVQPARSRQAVSPVIDT